VARASVARLLLLLLLAQASAVRLLPVSEEAPPLPLRQPRHPALATIRGCTIAVNEPVLPDPVPNAHNCSLPLGSSRHVCVRYARTAPARVRRASIEHTSSLPAPRRPLCRAVGRPRVARQVRAHRGRSAAERGGAVACWARPARRHAGRVPAGGEGGGRGRQRRVGDRGPRLASDGAVGVVGGSVLEAEGFLQPHDMSSMLPFSVIPTPSSAPCATCLPAVPGLRLQRRL